MRKYENFCRCFQVLEKSDCSMAAENEIYRTGMIGQFNLTFELAWKTLQEVLRLHAVMGADTGSPREIVKLGFRFGFIGEEDTWRAMLKDRNCSVHIYDGDKIDEIIERILECYIPAFRIFRDTMAEKIKEAEDEEN